MLGHKNIECNFITILTKLLLIYYKYDLALLIPIFSTPGASHGALRTDDDGHLFDIFSAVGSLALSLFVLDRFLKIKSSFKVANKALNDRSL